MGGLVSLDLHSETCRARETLPGSQDKRLPLFIHYLLFVIQTSHTEFGAHKRMCAANSLIFWISENSNAILETDRFCWEKGETRREWLARPDKGSTTSFDDLGRGHRARLRSAQVLSVILSLDSH